LRTHQSFRRLVSVKIGNTIGWGVFYDEKCQDDKAEQLCLVFVMFNNVIVDALFVLQPEGGFVPIVLLQPFGKKKKKNLTNLFQERESIFFVTSNESFN